MKAPSTQPDMEPEKEKPMLKYARKGSQKQPLRTYSTAQLHVDAHNHSKDQEQPSQKANPRKVEARQVRSSSQCETPKKSNAKSVAKVQLGVRKEGGIKRINLKIETPTGKKGEKTSLRDMNFDSYYNSEPPQTESKTLRAKRPHSRSSTHPTNEFQTVYTRCRRLIEDYQAQLDHARL